MSPVVPPALTAGERERVEQIDRFVALGEQGVAGLLGMLSDRSWSVRRAVVAGLAALGDDAVAPLCAWLQTVRSTERGIAAAVDALVASRGAGTDQAVIEMAASASAAVVADAAQILGRRGATMAGDALSRLIDHPDDNVAVSVIEAIGRLGGGAAVEPLVRAVRSDNFFRTFAAIGVLGSADDPRMLQPLADLLQDSRFTTEAARALGQSGDRGAVGPLASLLSQPTDVMLRVAVVALADLVERHQVRFGPSAQLDQTLREAVGPFTARLIQAVAQLDATGLTALCTIFGRLADPALIPTLAQLLDRELGVAEQAARALERLAHQSEAAFRYALHTADGPHRAMLLRRPALPGGLLAEILDDPDAEVRALACAAAARNGDSSVLERLFALLADPHAQVAQAALAAIQGLGGNQTESLALKAAASAQPGVRRAALRILGVFGFRSAYEIFLLTLREADERLGELAAYGLAFVDHPDAFALLCQQAAAARPRIRAAAMRGLGHRRAVPETLDVLKAGLADPDPWVRYFACQSLGKLGDEAAVPAIAARLEDGAGQVRIAALEALAQLRSDAAWTILASAAHAADPDIRRVALIGLGLSERPAAIPLLIAAARGGELAMQLVALSGLSKFTDSEALRELALAGTCADEQVRSAAVSFLADSAAPEADPLLVELVGRVDARHPAHAALSSGGRSRIMSVLAGLRSADKGAAAALTAALVRMKTTAADAALFEALTLPNPEARKAAAAALAEVGSAEVRVALSRAAAKDSDLEVRRICSALLTRG